MSSGRSAAEVRLEVEALAPDRAADVVDLLAQASEWSHARGSTSWTCWELELADFQRFARAGELFGMTSGQRLLACMVLQDIDPIHWPESPRGEALYVHKLGVRRSMAGCGLGRLMIDFACHAAVLRGVGQVRLDTAPATGLEAYYSRLGFTTDPVGPKTYQGRWLIRMEKPAVPRPAEAPCPVLDARSCFTL